VGLVFDIMNKTRSSVLGIVFLTVFLDIVGFSILFPLFPSLLDWYLAHEGPHSLIGELSTWLTHLANGNQLAVHTLFGGILGSLYGLLQFFFSVIWGALSDKIGRRPTLLFTLTGTLFSYVIWLFAGNFALLIASRILGGIMAGNISTASAAVADSTEPKDRAKGMAVVGVAIGLGFILGPAIGGFFASIHLEADVVEGVFTLHPFSGAALASLCLAALNLLWAARRFPETFPIEKRGLHTQERSLHPLRQLRRLNYPGVQRANILYLIYLTAFAGVEFTLTFLAVERLNYTPMDLAMIFVFVGLIIALVQGGLVRRLVPRLGERALVRFGLLVNGPGFLLLAEAQSSFVLYLGLAFMAIGSAFLMPCMSALVSRYSPPQSQGLSMGVFRSMGSLSRAAGPLLGAFLFWKYGSSAPYWAATGILLIPIGMAVQLPKPK
jgi:MFS family permease